MWWLWREPLSYLFQMLPPRYAIVRKNYVEKYNERAVFNQASFFSMRRLKLSQDVINMIESMTCYRLMYFP